jgi:hypothetical protein
LSLADTDGHITRFRLPLRAELFTFEDSWMVHSEVPPDTAVNLETWIVLGYRGTSRDAALEFIFPQTGKWQMTLDEYPDVSIPISIVAPSKEVDKQALRDIDVEWAASFLRASKGITQRFSVVQNTKTYLSRHGGSVYSLYPALVVAEASQVTEGSRDAQGLATIEQPLETIMRRSDLGTIGEQALFVMIELSMRGRGNLSRASELLAELERAYPQSHLIEEGRSKLRLGQRTEKPSVAPKPVAKERGTSGLQMSGIEAIPDGPRQGYEAYWKALAAEDIARLASRVAEGYVGMAGHRDDFLRKIDGDWSRVNLVSISVVVRTADLVDKYQYPDPEKPVSFAGPVCVVVSDVEASTVQLSDGKALKNQVCSMKTVLMKIDDEWKVATEHFESANAIAAQLIQNAFADMRGAMGRYEIYDGSRSYRLVDMLLAAGVENRASGGG